MKYKIEMKVTLPDVPIGRRYADMLERLETRQNRFVDRQEGCGEIVIDLLYRSELPDIEIKERQSEDRIDRCRRS